MATIIVLGAGVSGLTTALLLSQSNPNHQITVFAKHMPGDYSPEYTSPWAGANFLPMADESNSCWERDSWPIFASLAKDHPEAGIAFRGTRVLGRQRDGQSASGQWFRSLMTRDPWFRKVLPDFRPLDTGDLPPDFEFGAEFQSVCINTPIYLAWLVSQCLKHGISFQRGYISHIHQATAAASFTPPAPGSKTVVINCTGIGAAILGGVEDSAVVLARGQIVLVRNDPGNIMLVTSGTDDNPDEVCYIMKRPAGGGTILGGCYQEGVRDTSIDEKLGRRIMARAIQLCPALIDGQSSKELDVVSHGVGFRPVRKGGVRVEKQRLDDGVWVVHNYGHGGWGYQGSYGCAIRVVELVQEIVIADAKL